MTYRPSGTNGLQVGANPAGGYTTYPSIAKSGNAHALGAWDRWFESIYSDQFNLGRMLGRSTLLMKSLLPFNLSPIEFALNTSENLTSGLGD